MNGSSSSWSDHTVTEGGNNRGHSIQSTSDDHDASESYSNSKTDRYATVMMILVDAQQWTTHTNSD